LSKHKMSNIRRGTTIRIRELKTKIEDNGFIQCETDEHNTKSV